MTALRFEADIRTRRADFCVQSGQTSCLWDGDAERRSSSMAAETTGHSHAGDEQSND